MTEIVEIEVDKIDDPELLLHPENDLESLREMAESIRSIGQQVPILVKKKGERYQIIDGYRRVQAAKTFGIAKLRAEVTQILDRDALIVSATANIHRLENDPQQEAILFSKLKDDHNMSVSEVAKKFGKSITYIQTRLNLLLLPPKITDMVKAKKLSMGAAAELTQLSDKNDQLLLAADFIRRNTTVDQAKIIIPEFLSAKQYFADKKPEEQLDQARMTVKVRCGFCHQNKEIEKVKAYNMCDECHAQAIYLFVKENKDRSVQPG